MGEPSVAVCVGFRARSIEDHQTWDWCRKRWLALFPDWELCQADSGHKRYNRSAAHNAAARLTTADVLIFANSDTTTYEAADMRASVRSAAEGRWVLPERYFETSEGYRSVIIHEDPGATMPDPLSSYDRLVMDSPAGPQVVRRDQWLDVGGWDESFTGWGWGDAAIRDALDTLCGQHVVMGTSVHLYHRRTASELPQANGAMRSRWATKYKRAKRSGPEAMRDLVEQVKRGAT